MDLDKRRAKTTKGALSHLKVIGSDLALFRSAIENLPHGVSMFDHDDRLIISNDRYRDIYSFPPELMTPGTHFDALMDATPGGEIKDRGETETGAERQLRYNATDTVVVREWRLDDGKQIEITVARIADGACIALHEDVTEQRKVLQSIMHMARHDALTGLYNRERFFTLLEEALSNSFEDNQLALLAVDLDGFKAVNDTLGHAVGDELLVEVARRLKTHSGEQWQIARLGGDEFALFNTFRSAAGAAELVASRLLTAIKESFVINDAPVHISSSIGIAVAPNDGLTTDALLRNADLALYRAKADGRARAARFEPAMLMALNHKRSLEQDLRQALDRGEMEMLYQPIWGLERNQLTGFEALLRWNHPTLGQISPAEFIPIAEETGLIILIGEWAMKEACTEAANWPDYLSVAVNVSPTQFKSDLLGFMIAQALEDTGLAPHRLAVEITEGVLLQETERTLETLNRIHDVGATISLDDFGTGYASLGYLTRFPFDTLKIDGSFVRAASQEESATAIVKTIAALGKSLNIEIIAEGVETAEQQQMVRDFGCDKIQGYLISKPLAADALGTFIGQANLSTLRSKGRAAG